MKVNNLREAIKHSDTEKEFIQEDLREVDERLDAFRGYFNAVYNHVMGCESARFSFNAGYIDAEQLRERIAKLDGERRSAHELAINACSILNRMCDIYELEHLCPEVKRNALGVVINREEIADFCGQFVYNVFQEGIGGPSLEDIRQEKNLPTQFDTAFAIAEEDHREPNEAYEEDYDAYGEFDFDPADDD